jgi:hypothetical protein
MYNDTKLVEIFITIDDFAKNYSEWEAKNSLPFASNRGFNPKMSDSEIATIMILYHLSGYKCFEYFYREDILGHRRKDFPQAVSYNRFVEIMYRAGRLLFLFAQYSGALGEKTGTYFIDSTKLGVCNNRRINANKVCATKASRGKTSCGWFFGFKLHLVVNNLGQMVQCLFTTGSKSDNDAKVLKSLLANLKGSCFGDKGYMTKLFEYFKNNDLNLVTKIRKNMKNKFQSLKDKMLLNKRGVIESIFDILKTVCDLEHTRHRNVENLFGNTFASLGAYHFIDRKPSICIFEKTVKIKN